MVKVRNFWIHGTSIRLAYKKMEKKTLIKFFPFYGYVSSFFNHRLYNQVMRRYMYNDTILRMCAAGPLHCTNSSLRK
jgi:hypothetical protein